MEEIWKTIEGYPDYKVSNMGRVKSLKFGNERILKPGKDGNGYLKVDIWREGKQKTIKIHRLVAYAFVQNDSLFNNEINHLDENKENNCASNLEWSTREHNINFGTRNERVSKANTNGKKSKKVICIENGVVYPSTMEVQRQLGFDNGKISKCCNGKLKSAYKYHWKYVD